MKIKNLKFKFVFKKKDGVFNMKNVSIIFSIIFFLSSAIYILLGMYVIINNRKLQVNKVFFFICISLAIWALGFSMSISARNLESCLLWRRISALGWCGMHSMLLHFFLLLTGRKKLLKHWWFYLLLYSPAVICLYVFSISTNMTRALYNFEHTSWGWINISGNTAWDKFYNIYYVSFSIVGMTLLWWWGKMSQDKKYIKQSRVILNSFFIAIILGTITDTIFNAFLKITVPQMAPIIILIPISTIFYSTKKHGLMNLQKIPREELILSVASRERICHYFVVAMITGSILNFISQYFIYGIELKNCAFFSVEVICVALIIELVQHLKLTDEIKDNFILVLICFITVITTFQFIQFGSLTVWAYPFIFIVAFIAFNECKMLIVLGATILTTQTIVWILKPNVIVKIDGVNYFIRIVLFILAIGFARYINKIYVIRLNENAEQIRYQKLIANISSEFIKVNVSNLEEKINNMLKKSGEFFDVDRVYLLMIDSENETMTKTHEWCNNGIESSNQVIIDISIRTFPWLKSEIKEKGMLYVQDMREIQIDDYNEIQNITKQNIQSLIAIPIISNGKTQGVLGFDSVKSIKRWDENHIEMLKVGANLLGNAITKVNSEKMLDFMAYYDQLTKLPNHILFKDRVNQAIQLARVNGKAIGVLFLDLDSFKAVNDTLGHEAGDDLLKIIAGEISKGIQKSDVVARFGGDKFIVLINSILNQKDILKAAEKIMEIFNTPINIRNQEFFITASMGISVYPVDGKNVENLIKNAEVAMYNAKGKCKNQFELCSQEMKDDIKRETELSNLLYRALERNELKLYYQPQVNIQSREIVGFEALLRWNNSEFGNVPPSIFIPIAEKTGLINQIGEWIIRTACAQNKAWQDLGLPKFRMGVNLSPIQFRNSKLASKLENILKETELEPEDLEIEITESMLVKDKDYLIDIMKDLKNLGVYIAIDDFGTEYSSLSRLNMLPIDRIKMDIRFVRGIEGNDKDRAIVNIILNLAKNLDINVIAEGVENKTQLEYLSQRMCDEVQGFYFYKPMPAEEIEEILLKDVSNK